ncbi:MAG: hypothetical protein IOC39_15175 [Burkholderia sp.]|jgi:hypothetical protein|uniref:hypothetical protein n=1 Tax=Burkholderia sp. TaxID=36773 RepID=UPI00258BFD81|nr:hypothetical protein [Burkholderia sp.]MCA3779147.1 hypothetical protein [Burkholderia sp.]MCA3786353.1 hypothetical protein [Burkholderia sp.]MCA3797134.1 hypothetical protein [Burkholderia sp.]MCA3801003.1 hypothetical protein [Burkholderia sp.]MCA3812117.1 hypothetical protein [Burkholderia sp.]
MIDRKPQLARAMAALSVSVLLGACATASDPKPRPVVGPAYPFMQFDAQRVLLTEPVANGNHPSTRWRFVDSARHTSTAFPSGSEIEYTMFRSDNPDTIVIYAGQQSSARCTSGIAKDQACPRLFIWLSTDGGQHFLRRVIDLPALAHTIYNNAGSRGGTPPFPVPAMVVERGILYVATGGDAKPLVRANERGALTVLSTGEAVESETTIGRGYVWPKEIEMQRSYDKIGPLKRGPVYLFAVTLPATTQVPPYEPATGDASGANASVCTYRRMRKVSSTLPNLTAVPLVGSRIERAPALPDYAVPTKMPYESGDLYHASISEARRGELIDKWRNVYPEWAAAQPPVSKFTPRTLLEPGAAEIDCGPDYTSRWD